jgi:alpha-galactosidase/6-phospho-beta-glucosidase family protein
MTVDACLKKDRQLALRALRLDPVCAHLTTQQVNQLGDKLLAAHRRFITSF